MNKIFSLLKLYVAISITAVIFVVATLSITSDDAIISITAIVTLIAPIGMGMMVIFKHVFELGVLAFGGKHGQECLDPIKNVKVTHQSYGMLIVLKLFRDSGILAGMAMLMPLWHFVENIAAQRAVGVALALSSVLCYGILFRFLLFLESKNQFRWKR